MTAMFCQGDVRRAPIGLGIRQLVVDDAGRTLRVVLTETLLPQSLARGHFRVDGGVRVQGVRVLSVAPQSVVAGRTDSFDLGLDRLGDSGPYRLTLLHGVDDSSVPSLDPLYQSVSFRFRLSCGDAVDCGLGAAEPNISWPESPLLDREGKDFAAFKRFMEERVTQRAPEWVDRSPAAHGEMLIELVSAVADELSYAQDRALQEAFLTTARHRWSIVRHAQLHDVEPEAGRSARTVLAFTVAAGAGSVWVEQGTAALTRASSTSEPVVFETEVGFEADEQRNVLQVWRDLLPEGPLSGATGELWVQGHHALRVGSWVVLDDQDKQMAVQLAHDAAPSTARYRQEGGGWDVRQLTHLRWETVWPTLVAFDPDQLTIWGNCAMATHGRRRELSLAIRGGRAALSTLPPARPVDLALAPPAAPAVAMRVGDEVWQYQDRLILASPSQPVFGLVVEDDGRTTLEVGDGIDGAALADGTEVEVSFREGVGHLGNVGSGSLREWPEGAPAGLESVFNPVPAFGGSPPQSHGEVMAEVRRHLRQRLRAVTAADHEAAALEVAGVRAARAALSWTGTWYTLFLHVLPINGLDPSSALLGAVERHIEEQRMATREVCVMGPHPVPLLIGVELCLEPAAQQADVEQGLHHALFDPDQGVLGINRLGFGHPVAWSQVMSALEAIVGLRYVRITEFRRLHDATTDLAQLGCGQLSVGPLEVLRLENDPLDRERGVLEVVYRRAGGEIAPSALEGACHCEEGCS